MKKEFFKKCVCVICAGSLALLSMNFGAAGKPKLSKTKVVIRAGKTFSLKVSNASKKVKWSVNNIKVIKIKAKSKCKATFKALKKGKATITAKIGSKVFKCRVTVRYKNQKKGKTVYITDTGLKYHKYTCRFLRKSKTKVSLSWAKSHGYTQCSVCY